MLLDCFSKLLFLHLLAQLPHFVTQLLQLLLDPLILLHQLLVHLRSIADLTRELAIRPGKLLRWVLTGETAELTRRTKLSRPVLALAGLSRPHLAGFGHLLG